MHQRVSDGITAKKLFGTVVVGAFSLITLIIVMIFISPVAANATVSAGGYSMSPVGPNMFETQNEVIRGTSKATASAGAYPWDSNPASVGIDARGATNLTQYVGEVPYALRDEESCKDLFYYQGDIKDGAREIPRSFQSRDSCDDSATFQYQGLENNAANPGGSLFATITSSIVWLMQQLNYLLLWIKNLDLIGFIDDAAGGIFTSIKEAIIWNDDGPALPLIIALAVFIVSMVPSVWRYMKGEGGKNTVFSKIGIFFLSLILTGIAISSGPTAVSGASADLASDIQQEIVISGTSDGAATCKYDTDDEDMDLIRTMFCGSMIPMFEASILSQFGYASSDLDITDFPNATAAMETAFGTSGGSAINPFESMPNLGWYWVNGQTRITSGDNFDGNKNTSADDQRPVLIIDFLDALRTAGNNADNVDLQDKIDTIAKYMSQPDYGSAGVNNLLLAVYYILNLIIMINLTGFVLVGVVSVALCGVIMIASPILLFFKPQLVMDIFKTYAMGFLRILLGAVLTILYTTITGVLFSYNFYAAIALSIVIGFVLAKYGPRLLKILNEKIAKHETFAPVRAMNRGMNRVIWNRGGADRLRNERRRRSADLKDRAATIRENDGVVKNLDEKLENSDILMVENKAYDPEKDSTDQRYNTVETELHEKAVNSEQVEAYDMRYISREERASVLNGDGQVVVDESNNVRYMENKAINDLRARGIEPKTATFDQDLSNYSNEEQNALKRGDSVILRDARSGDTEVISKDEARRLDNISSSKVASYDEAREHVDTLKKENKTAKRRVITKRVGNTVDSASSLVSDSHNEISATRTVVKKGTAAVIRERNDTKVTFKENEL